MSRERPRCQYVDEDGRVCGLLKAAAPHVWYGDGTHDYEPPAREGFGAQRAPLRTRSERPGRVAREQDTRTAMVEYARTHPECEGPAYGAPGDCGGGMLDVHHREPRGMGGGKDTKVFARLCRDHHNWAESNRSEARRLGLLRRKPPVDLPPRPIIPPAPTQ